MNYQFKQVFIRYVLILSCVIGLIYIGIITIFTWQVNQEIRESALTELNDIDSALDEGKPIGQESYYFKVTGNNIVSNHTPLESSFLKQQILIQQPDFVIKNDKDRYHVEHTDNLYLMVDITDYEETKALLFRLLLVLLILTLFLVLGAAYYIAIKPIRTYETMLQQHKEFIQNASHELKTPIASISLGTDYILALDQSKLSERSLDALRKIKREVKYMQGVIHQSLNVELEEKSRSQTMLSAVLDEVIEQQLQLHHVSIIRNYPAELKTSVSGDQLKQMVTILLDNAIKHNEEVEIVVSAKHEAHILQLEVTDNGRGIPPHQIDYIFERYMRGDTSAEGSGIGLALLKSQVTKLRGEIEVISQLNTKTSFIIKIPD